MRCFILLIQIIRVANPEIMKFFATRKRRARTPGFFSLFLRGPSRSSRLKDYVSGQIKCFQQLFGGVSRQEGFI